MKLIVYCYTTVGHAGAIIAAGRGTAEHKVIKNLSMSCVLVVLVPLVCRLIYISFISHLFIVVISFLCSFIYCCNFFCNFCFLSIT